jgi:hypothetical protein
LNFWSQFWTPPIVGKEKQKQWLLGNWDECFQITLERFALLVSEDIETKNIENVNIVSISPFSSPLLYFFFILLLVIASEI